MRLCFLFLSALISSGHCEDVSYEKLAVVQSKTIGENSGIDLSYKYPNAVWTHNDSGGKPWLFLVSLVTGKTLATVVIEGSLNKDWEDIATFQRGGKSYIVVADTGDNYGMRNEYQLCILEEPNVEFSESSIQPSGKWTSLRFKYEDDSKNCESIGVDLANNRFILIEKIYQRSRGITGAYFLDIPNQDKTDGVARRFASLKAKNFSALDISEDNLTLIARAYHAGYVFRRTRDQTWASILGGPLPSPIEFPMQLQGEGVCFTTDGNSVLISTEKKKQPIYKVKLPVLAD